MKLTEALKRYLREKFGVSESADDNQYRKTVAEKLASGELTPAQFAELTVEKAGDPKTIVGQMVSEQVRTLTEPLAKSLEAIAGRLGVQTPAPAATASTADNIDALVEKRVELAMQKHSLGALGTARQLPSYASVLSGAGDDGTATLPGGNVRVKRAIEQYDGARKGAYWSQDRKEADLRGMPALNPYTKQPLNHPSQADNAVIGAFTKWRLLRGGAAGPRMTEHEKDLLLYAAHEMPWSGQIGAGADEVEIANRKMSDFEVKALLDESGTSQGQNAVPIVFDDAVILVPVLYGEFFPLVTVVNISRGSRVNGFSLVNPTVTQGIDGTGFTLFNTSAFAASFNNNVYAVMGAIEIGLDFLSDAPNNIGAIVTQQFGLKIQEWLDTVISVGDGSTQPTGIFTASGTTSVSAANTSTGPPTLADYEALLFGVPKQHRRYKGGRNAYLMNELTYRRARAMATGISSDQRRLLGMDHESFTILGYPAKISAQIGNRKSAFANLGEYRLYRRLGMQVRVETAGQTLGLKNTQIIIVRSRWAGNLEQGAAAAVCTNGQA